MKGNKTKKIRTISSEDWVAATLQAINYNDFNAVIDRIKNLETEVKKIKREERGRSIFNIGAAMGLLVYIKSRNVRRGENWNEKIKNYKRRME